MANDADVMRAMMINVLRSGPCGNISFALASFTIMPYAYGYVADMLAQGAYTIIFPSTGYSGGYVEGGRFEFDPSVLANGMSPDSRATIVHEATHAAISATHPGQWIMRADNEFAAYLAQTIYAMNAGDPLPTDGFVGAPMSALASTIVAASSNGVYQITAAACDDLELSIMYFYNLRAQQAGKAVPYSDLMLGVRSPGAPMVAD